MKGKLILISLLGILAMATANAATYYNISNKDNNLYLGFYAGEDVSTKSVLINLGTSADVFNGFTMDLSGASSALSTTFNKGGTNWYNSPEVYWGLIGYDGVSTNISSFYVGRPTGQDPLVNGGDSTTLTAGDRNTLRSTVASLIISHTSGDATIASVVGSTGNTNQISIVPNGNGAFDVPAGFAYDVFQGSVYGPIGDGLSIQKFTYDGSAYPTTSGSFVGINQSNGIVSFKSLVTPPSGYSGPWNWTAASGNWDATTNWTSNQVASNGFAVDITGVLGGIITNNAVTNISSLTFSNGAGAFTLTGTNAFQTLTISGGITNNSAKTQTIDLSIAGEGGVTQSGSGTTVLARSNSYIGGTTLSSGAVVIGNNNALGSGSVTLSGASSLIAGTANLSTTNAMAINAATTIDTAGNRWTNAGALSGTGSLTKIGSGTLTLSGTSASYSGASSVNNGAMQVTGNLGTGTVTVNNGASLSGTGTVGAVSLKSGGILTGGVDGGVGKLTVSENLSFSAGGILNWKLSDASGLAGTGFDSFDVRGTLDLTGLTTGSTLQFNILNAVGGTTGFLNNQNSQWLVASANSIAGFATNDFTISTAGFTNALGGGAFGFITNSTGLILKFTALGVDPWTGNIAAGSNVISGQTITSTNNAVIGANSSRNGSVAVTNNSIWKVQGNLQVGGSTNGSGTLTIGSGGRIEANGLTISDQRGSRGLVLITNRAASDAISLGAGTVSFGAGNGTLQFAHSNAVTISNAIAGKGVISSTGTGTTTLSGNQAGFTGTNSLSSGKVVLASGVTNGGIVNIAGRGTNVVFAMNTNSVLSSTGTHAVAGLLLDHSGMAFKDSIKGSVALAPTGVLQKTYTNGQSVAGFGAGIGAGKSFSILAGTAASNGANVPTLQAKIVNGQLDFHGTTTNAIVMSMKDPSYSSIRNQIQWLNTNVPSGTTPYWTNTVAGNIGNVTNSAISGMNNKSFAGSFDRFLLSVNTNSAVNWGDLKLVDRQDQGVVGSLLDELNLRGAGINTYLAKIMGAFGYDNATKTSWAVINHNSIFGDGLATFTKDDLLNDSVDADLLVFSSASGSGTIQAVPEPGTWALLTLGGLALAIVGMRRCRS
jgi:autotransporter-associated beta strand protein/T5SS/PEP-CTERM-associated repeat protein